MNTSFPRHLHALDNAKRVIELIAILLIAPLDGAAPRRDLTMRRGHPLHRGRVERQEVVPPAMLVLAAAPRDAGGRVAR